MSTSTPNVYFSDFDSALQLSAYRLGRGPTPPTLLRAGRAELRRVVRQLLERGGAASAINPTVVINEVARRMLGSSGAEDLADRGEFFADLADALRRALGDLAAQPLPSDPPLLMTGMGAHSIARVDAALRELETASPTAAEAAVLRLFAGMTSSEAARQLKLPAPRLEAVWDQAKAHLEERLGLR